MDFSSISRALESLHRRQPPLSDHILSVSNELYTLIVNKKDHTTGNTSSTVVVVDDHDVTTATTSSTAESSSSRILKLLQALMCDTNQDNSPRWESLAVGLYIATEILVMMKSITNTKNPSGDEASPMEITTMHPAVYMDGPRVPITTIHQIPTAVTSVTTTTIPMMNTTRDENSHHNVAVAGVVAVSLTQPDTIQLLRTMHNICMKHLEHSEPRLRTLVAKAVGAYSAQIIQITTLSSSNNKAINDMDDTTTENTDSELQSFLQQMHHMLLESIEHHIRVGRNSTSSSSIDVVTTNVNTTTDPTSTNTLVDDTTGWRAIETNWFCFASFINGLSDQYYYMFPLEDVNTNSANSTLYTKFAYCAIQHVSRHVRAAAMQTYEQLIHAITLSIITHKDENLRLVLSQPTSLLRTTLIDIVKTGLADNWSQVRMASSVLCRVWFQSLLTLQISIQEPMMMSALLPRMCLNRFYPAHGVKLYSHETWKLIFGSTSSAADGRTSGSLGLQLVAENINAMIRYYIKMCDADNHEVREAACQAIAELAVKVGTNEQYGKNVLDEQQIQNFIAVLLMCFYDESWPVRDEACVTCGILCKAFPQACHTEIFHKTLWQRIAEQVTDQIWSVRENAAVAVGDVLEAYGNEILPKVQTLIKTLLPSARDQPSMSASEYKAYMNDLKQQQQAESQLYSIGSLVPKFRKGGAARFGCADCDIDRPKAPWEATDGCIFLIREYVIRRTVDGTTIPISDDELIPICTELADVCRVRHFPQSDELRSTLWKCLPTIAAALGKQRFKNRYLDIFMDLLFSNLESSSASQLSYHAAGQCAEELALLIGMNMFRARLEDHQRHIFDQIVQERQRMPKGLTGVHDIFSPFGPPDLMIGMVPP